MTDNLISMLAPACEAAEADDLVAFDIATKRFVLALRNQSGHGDDLALLGVFESVLALDRDFDVDFPAVVKSMRERIIHARHEQAARN
jgi:hypothetical protein